jgi:hypothetical protein
MLSLKPVGASVIETGFVAAGGLFEHKTNIYSSGYGDCCRSFVRQPRVNKELVLVHHIHGKHVACSMIARGIVRLHHTMAWYR